VKFSSFITEVKTAVVSYWSHESFYEKNCYYVCICRWNNTVL